MSNFTSDALQAASPDDYAFEALSSSSLLDPKLTRLYTVTRYVSAVCFGAYLWDICTNLRNDYKLLFKHNLRMPTIVYFLSRLFTVAYLTCIVALAIGPIENCQVFYKICVSFGSLSAISTSFVFFLRVRAVFRRETEKVVFFFILWIFIVAMFTALPFAYTSSSMVIDATRSCTITDLKSYANGALVASFIYKTCIVGFISHRIISIHAISDHAIDKVKIFFGLVPLPFISRALLQGSQQYYLVSIFTDILLEFVAFLSPNSNITSLVPFVFSVTMQNMMACIVFRQMKFGFITRDGVSDAPVAAESIHFTEPSIRPEQSAENDRNDAVITDAGKGSAAHILSTKIDSQSVSEIKLEQV